MSFVPYGTLANSCINGSKASEPDQLINVEDNILNEAVVRSTEWGTPHENSEEIADNADRVPPDVDISPDSLDLGLEEVGEDLSLDEFLNNDESPVDFIDNEDMVESFFREEPEEEHQYFPSGRPKRNKVSGGRPLDGDYIYYT